MITKDELIDLLHSTETYRIERTVSTTDMDKFQEAIYAFSNDLPGSRKKGYLILGVHDNGRLSGLKVDDNLLKKISGIRSDGNILPLPTMAVDRYEFAEGDILVAEVTPSLIPPVRYRGRTFVRIGPRRDIATEAEERILTERRTTYMATFDATPCFTASMDDVDTEYIEKEYLPKAIDAEVLQNDRRSIKEQMASLHLYDLQHDCPTYSALILFGRNPKFFMPGAYIQYVHFKGMDKGGDILNERQLHGSLCRMLPQVESFIRDAIVTARPVPISILREKTVYNYPYLALRELMMNACMHRDYQSNMPIRLYRFDDHIEIMNAGGLYGEARPENFPMVNDYRNPIVAEAMRNMKYVNMFNRGIQRVKEMFGENGNPEPAFSVDKITAFEVKIVETERPKDKRPNKKTPQESDKTPHKKQERHNAVIDLILNYCNEPQSLSDILVHVGLKDRNHLRTEYINPLLESGRLRMLYPDSPKCRNQKYITIENTES